MMISVKISDFGSFASPKDKSNATEGMPCRAELFIKHSLINEAIDCPLIKSRVKDYEVKDYESFEEMKIMLLHSPRWNRM
jgi:hypothetical protein